MQVTTCNDQQYGYSPRDQSVKTLYSWIIYYTRYYYILDTLSYINTIYNLQYRY